MYTHTFDLEQIYDFVIIPCQATTEQIKQNIP